MKVELSPGGAQVPGSAITVRGAGVSGTARVVETADAKSRGPGDGLGVVGAELAKSARDQGEPRFEDVDDPSAWTLELELDPDSPGAIELDTPTAGPDDTLVMVYVDSAGMLHFELPDQAIDNVGSQTWSLQPRMAPPHDADKTVSRGPIGALGKHIVKWFLAKGVKKLAGAAAKPIARMWEDKYRPKGIRPFSTTTYQEQPDYKKGDLISLPTDGRALMFVHGTFSRSTPAFHALPPKLLSDLEGRYGGRVFAFDHPTLSVDPLANVESLLERLPHGKALDVDIVAHSRGGLVARELIEKAHERVKVGKVVLVGTPNAGTPLVDAKHMGTFLDALGNMIGFIPGPAGDFVETLATLLMEAVQGSLAGLPGLQAMHPKGKYLEGRNVVYAGLTKYCVLGADYEPTGSLGDWAKDKLMDTIFGVQNDLVVPTEGATTWLHAPEAREHETFPGTLGVSHNAYFGHAKTHEALAKWLLGSE